ncbi:hypothetical protein [Paenibacillus sp. 1P07SE]|uniref:hypothetical protein n=1 Tax=Paenibacillus sp. 1P07SE TaxID=3132209 RepID=UPI0039A5E6F3
MKMNQTLPMKVAVLREHEVYGYRIAVHLLQDEAKATAAAKEALLELYETEAFFSQPARQQQQTVNRVFIKYSLMAYRTMLHQQVKSAAHDPFH